MSLVLNTKDSNITNWSTTILPTNHQKPQLELDGMACAAVRRNNLMTLTLFTQVKTNLKIKFLDEMNGRREWEQSRDESVIIVWFVLLLVALVGVEEEDQPSVSNDNVFILNDPSIFIFIYKKMNKNMEPSHMTHHQLSKNINIWLNPLNDKDLLQKFSNPMDLLQRKNLLGSKYKIRIYIKDKKTYLNHEWNIEVM